MMGLVSVGTPALWIGFSLLVLAMLALDLGVFHREAHEVRTGEALLWTAVWVALSLVFALGLWIWTGFDSEVVVQYLAGYLVEKALSVDNLFVFLVVFSHFSVPASQQHRVLFWGILGALVTRACFIFLGAALLQAFSWVVFIFGGFLIVTGIKMLWPREGDLHPERNLALRLFRRLVPATTEYHGGAFFVVESGRRCATPLLLVLVTIEAMDVIFAVDSIPAIFAITSDPFIVFTSNIFAILGLRALYFAVARAMGKFRYLKVGLALVLAFVGTKMLLAGFKIHISSPISLAVIAALLGASIAASLVAGPAKPE